MDADSCEWDGILLERQENQEGRNGSKDAGLRVLERVVFAGGGVGAEGADYFLEFAVEVGGEESCEFEAHGDLWGAEHGRGAFTGRGRFWDRFPGPALGACARPVFAHGHLSLQPRLSCGGAFSPGKRRRGAADEGN